MQLTKQQVNLFILEHDRPKHFKLLLYGKHLNKDSSVISTWSEFLKRQTGTWIVGKH